MTLLVWVMADHPLLIGIGGEVGEGVMEGDDGAVQL